MSRNRYVKDYRLVETVNEKGRIHTESEYIGPAYRFTGGWERASGLLWQAAGLCGLGWVLFIGAMLPVSQAMRTFYVSLPFIFTAVPLALTTGTVLGTLASKGKMEHRHADRIENRYPASAFFTFMLPLMALIGEGISILNKTAPGGGDAVFATAAAALCGCGLALFRSRRRFRCEKTEPVKGEGGAADSESSADAESGQAMD